MNKQEKSDQCTPCTPCIGVCKMEGRFCKGCYRTIEEVALWMRMNRSEREYVMRLVEERKELFGDYHDTTC